MTPKWSECSSKYYRKLSSLENRECESAVIETIPSYISCFDLPTPTVNRMCSLSAHKEDDNVYKRRKMDKDLNSLAEHEEAKESMVQISTTSEDQSSLLKPVVPLEAMVLSAKAGRTGSMQGNEEPAGVLSEASSDMNDKCIVSTEKKDAVECSSSNISSTEQLTELASRDICISILKEDLIITGSRTRITTEDFTNNDGNPLVSCNHCGAVEYLLKMLICDSCEAAFHLSCCNLGIEELPDAEWFCKTCSLMKPKAVYGKLSEGKVKPSVNTNQRPPGMGHIEYMLKNTEEYVSGARIGRDFQADVPEWSGPASSTDGYFDEPFEFDPAELTQLNNWKISNENRASIGNWIQCRDTTDFGDSGKICGKWRRAPLYVVQSDDWDCSCCLLWDPAHADCAVPQELKTSEVLKQLKYVNMVKKELVGQSKKPL